MVRKRKLGYWVMRWTRKKAVAVSTEQVRRTFDRHATEFDGWFTRNRELYVSELNALEAARPTGVTLDVGVGSGVFASRLEISVGVDTSRELLKISKRRGLEVILADARYLPFRTGAFDTVVSSFTICFIGDVRTMLKESRRVLKDRGRLILGEITLDSAWGKRYSREGSRGHRFYGIATFRTFGRTLTLLGAAGFTVARVLGTIDFGPSDEPRIESPADLTGADAESIGRYGFVCIVAGPEAR